MGYDSVIQRVNDVNWSLRGGRSLPGLPACLTLLARLEGNPGERVTQARDGLPFDQAMAKATLLTISEQAGDGLLRNDTSIEQGVLMSPLPSNPRGMYFEEFQPGQVITSVGRTVTEADIVNFAGLSGDFNQIHIDAEYSKKSLAGQRIAHGLLVLSIASGLAVQTGVLEGTIIVFREINEWKFIQPVYIGDTIHVELEVMETKAMRRVGGGTVMIEIRVKNQSEQTVMKGIWTVLIASKPE